MRVDLQAILGMPGGVWRPTRLGADVVLRQYPTGSQDQREAAGGALLAWDVLGEHEASLAADELLDVHGGRTRGSLVIAWPLHAAQFIQLGKADTGEGGHQAGDFVHDLRSMGVVHRIAQGIGEQLRDFPILITRQRRHYAAYRGDAPFGVGERPAFLQERGTGQEDMGKLGGFVEEEILNHHAFHRPQGGMHMLGIGV